MADDQQKSKIYFTKPGDKLRCTSCNEQRTLYFFGDSSAMGPEAQEAASDPDNDFEDEGGTVRATWLCIVCGIKVYGKGWRQQMAHPDVQLSADDAEYARSQGSE